MTRATSFRTALRAGMHQCRFEHGPERIGACIYDLVTSEIGLAGRGGVIAKSHGGWPKMQEIRLNKYSAV